MLVGKITIGGVTAAARAHHLRLSAALALASWGCGDGGPGPISPEPPGPAPVSAAVVLTALPHDASAFTQGLLFHEGTLYESTGRVGESSLRVVQLSTGEVLRRVDLPPPYFAEGLAAHDGRLYQLTWRENTAFVYEPVTLARLGAVTYAGEGWGLTSDGVSLIRSDGTSFLDFLDPACFQVHRRLEVMDGTSPVPRLNELEWVRGEIWANVWLLDRIARIDPATGVVKGWIELAYLAPPVRFEDPDAVPNGIAYDDRTGRLYVTGKLWPVLYQLALPPDL